MQFATQHTLIVRKARALAHGAASSQLCCVSIARAADGASTGGRVRPLDARERWLRGAMIGAIELSSLAAVVRGLLDLADLAALERSAQPARLTQTCPDAAGGAAARHTCR